METLLQDIRYGARSLIKNRSFTIVAILALALGIGANTAIFSVVNTVLLSPLPYADPDRLMTIWENKLTGDSARGQDSPVTFADWRDQKQIFDSAAGWWYPQVNLTQAGAEPERVRTIDTTDEFFSVLGVNPTMGRSFLSGEDKQGGAKIAVIGYGLWQRRFGSDPNIVGKPITLDDQPYTIVGVMPAGFHYPQDTEVWRPLGWNPTQHSRGAHFFEVIARLKPGVTVARAQSDLSSLAVRIAQENPRTNSGWGVTIVPLREQLLGNYRLALLVLLGAVGFVLLIACANVANLQLARAGAREKEITIRLAIGASRSRIVRQLLTESVLLAIGGATVGLALASFGGNFLMAINPVKIPLLDSFVIDGKILAFNMLIAVSTGLIFGLIPALQASKTNLNHTLKEGGRDSRGGAGGRIRSVLVSAEIAITLVLLIGAGLLLKSFVGLQRIDTGFNPTNVLTFNLQLPGAKYSDWRQVSSFYSQLVDRLKAMPGVQSADVTAYLPLESGYRIPIVDTERPVGPDTEQIFVQYRMAGPDYFQTMGIPLLKGRQIEDRDNADTHGVVILNQAAVRHYWQNENPIGKRVRVGRRIGPLAMFIPESQEVEIIGIVGDEKNSGLNTAAEPAIYFPQNQYACRSMSVVVRAASNPMNLSNSIRNEVWSLDKNMPVSNLTLMTQIVSNSIAQSKFSLVLLGSFAGLALILASVGIYGVMAYSVTQRTHEIGIRMALGAQQRSVLVMILGEGMKLASIGVVVGFVGALALTHFLRSLLYNVSATDPITFALVAGVLVVVAGFACYIPARRATRVDPLVALRYD